MSSRFARIMLLVVLLLTSFGTLSPQPSTSSLVPQRTPQFENDDVAVWKTVVAPNTPLTMHTHQHARVIVALAGGTMKVVYEDGASETHNWETGKAYWLPIRKGSSGMPT